MNTDYTIECDCKRLQVNANDCRKNYCSILTLSYSKFKYF